MLASCQRGRALGGREMLVAEHVLCPHGSAELVVVADGGDEVGAVVEAGLGDAPGLGGDVGVFDTDGGGVGIPVACMPGGVAIPHELADPAVGVDLVVGGCLAGLPHVPDGLDGEVACVVVDDDLVDLPAASSGAVVLVHQPVFVGFEGGPVLHQRFSFSAGVVVWLGWCSRSGLPVTSRVTRSRARRI